MQVQVVTRDGFEAVGLMWEGTYAAAGKGEIRELLPVLQGRWAEIGGVADREHIVGISWNEATPVRQTSGDGFRYFVGVRVAGGAGRGLL
jgi:predicted transcriptional regulator YdeE